MVKEEKKERRGRRGRKKERESEFEQRIVEISRVTRVMAGGKRMRFRACVVIGDMKKRVAMALAKGGDVTVAVNKAAKKAEKHMITVPIVNGTIPHAVRVKFKAAIVMLKPAPQGTGVVAGGPTRAVAEMAGISNIVVKMLGSNNKMNNVQAMLIALERLHQPKVKSNGSKSS
ncbi:MAG: 30S ribosomal protein S5 [bacterium]|nr:30S ribosomal protein S5 [bacterium]